MMDHQARQRAGDNSKLLRGASVSRDVLIQEERFDIAQGDQCLDLLGVQAASSKASISRINCMCFSESHPQVDQFDRGITSAARRPEDTLQ